MNYMLWCDLETTGLEPETDQILEIALILTDTDLVEVGRWQSVVRPERPLTMDPYVAAMHAENGLLVDVNDFKGSLYIVEQNALRFLEGPRMKSQDALLLAGSTIEFDRSFIRAQMPALYKVLHYRSFDVSTLKAAARMWIGELPEEGESKHRAMPDAEGSLELARTFQDAFKDAQIPLGRDLGIKKLIDDAA